MVAALVGTDTDRDAARDAVTGPWSGEGDLTAGGDAWVAAPGAWLRMPANTRHSVVARTPMVMALYLLPPER